MSTPATSCAEVPQPLPQWETLSDGSLLVRAPAKINLCLHVGKKRADGYHELDSLVAKVTLYDELILTRQDDGPLEFHCDSADAGPDEQNLALRGQTSSRAAGKFYGRA